MSPQRPSVPWGLACGCRGLWRRKRLVTCFTSFTFTYRACIFTSAARAPRATGALVAVQTERGSPGRAAGRAPGTRPESHVYVSVPRMEAPVRRRSAPRSLLPWVLRGGSVVKSPHVPLAGLRCVQQQGQLSAQAPVGGAQGAGPAGPHRRRQKRKGPCLRPVFCCRGRGLPRPELVPRPELELLGSPKPFFFAQIVSSPVPCCAS